MVRTKNTARLYSQGEIARFEHSQEAIAPNTMKCDHCEKTFSNPGNLARHTKESHGPSTFRYDCPMSPDRGFSRRSDLRSHFRTNHPGADVDEVDFVHPVEVPRDTQPASAKRPAAAATTGKQPIKKKVKTSATLQSSASSSASCSTVDVPEPPRMDGVDNHRLVKIKETITREYFFEK